MTVYCVIGLIVLASALVAATASADVNVRFGDKSVETVVRTDERYGGSAVFQGPRGWSYWNLLSDPKPIQNPNLWPDTQSTYFLTKLDLPAGVTLTLRGIFPRARYYKLALYRQQENTFVSIGEELAGWNIVPDPGSSNPFVVGANRLAEQREFTVSIVAADAPANATDRRPNVLYAGARGGVMQLITRIYLSDQGSDGAGFGPWKSSYDGKGLPHYEGALADGTKLSAVEVERQFIRPFTVNTAQPFTADQWYALIADKKNDPTLDPMTAPARPDGRWVKYWNIKHSIIGSFLTPEAQAKIPYAGPIDGGGDPATNYLFVQLSRKFGPVYVVRGKMPKFPNTYAGSGEAGLEIMPEAQTQYWSVVSCEAAPSGHVVDGLTDMQVPLNESGQYTIVYSRKEDRPTNATAENGVAWIEWSPRGEGVDDPRNRSDFGMLMMRIMAPDPDWENSPTRITAPGMEEAIMGPYYPRGEYMTKEQFEKSGP